MNPNYALDKCAIVGEIVGMKTELVPTPPSLTLVEIMQHFATEEKARQYLEAIRWPNGPVCPHCHNSNQARIWRIAANPAKKIRPGLLHCAECNKQFTVTVGTIFEDSHIPLNKWLIAWYLLNSSKKGISSLQIQRTLGLGSYRSALFMMHRIRHALQDPALSGVKLGGTVEIDETYIGGKAKGMGRGYLGNKTAVVSLVQRDGKARTVVMTRVTGESLNAFLKAHVKASATIYTDQLPAYRPGTKGFKRHEHVNHHVKEYVRGDVHTNTVEGFFSILKRGIVGTFHNVSEKHLPLYLAEFDHRHNTRKMTDGERSIVGLRKMEGKRLMYKSGS